MTAEPAKPAAQTKTKLFVAPGVVLEGRVKHAGAPDEWAVISGRFHGDIEWNGVIHVLRGATVTINESLRCRELNVAGTIVAATDGAQLEVGMLRLASTGQVQGGTLVVPSGRIAQERGCVLHATLRMVAEGEASPRPGGRPMLVVNNSPAAAADLKGRAAPRDLGTGTV